MEFLAILFFIFVTVVYIGIHSTASFLLSMIAGICIVIAIRSIITNLLLFNQDGIIRLGNIAVDLTKAYFSYKLFFSYAKYCSEALGFWSMLDSAFSFVIVFLIGGFTFLASEVVSLASLGDEASVIPNIIVSYVFCIIAAALLIFGNFPVF